MTLLIGSLQLGFLYSIMVLGIYISGHPLEKYEEL